MAYAARSFNDGNHSFRNIGGKQFIIEPECLNGEQLQYELRLRGIAVVGTRRVDTGALREAIEWERLHPRENYVAHLGTVQYETDQVNHAIFLLRGLLDDVQSEEATQIRFMTLYLHYEGRLNRIEARVQPNENLSLWIFTQREYFSSYYNEFIEKLRQLYREVRLAVETPLFTPRNPITDPAMLQVIPRQVTTSEGPLRQEGGGGEIEPTTRRIPQLNEFDGSAGQAPMNLSLNGENVHAHRNEDISQRELAAEPPVHGISDEFLRDLGVSRDSNLNPEAGDFVNRRNRRPGNVQIEDIGPENRREIVREFEVRPDTTSNNNATLVSNADARISQQFRQFGDTLPTPILHNVDAQQFTFDQRRDDNILNPIIANPSAVGSQREQPRHTDSRVATDSNPSRGATDHNNTVQTDASVSIVEVNSVGNQILGLVQRLSTDPSCQNGDRRPLQETPDQNPPQIVPNRQLNMTQNNGMQYVVQQNRAPQATNAQQYVDPQATSAHQEQRLDEQARLIQQMATMISALTASVQQSSRVLTNISQRLDSSRPPVNDATFTVAQPPVSNATFTVGQPSVNHAPITVSQPPQGQRPTHVAPQNGVHSQNQMNLSSVTQNMNYSQGRGDYGQRDRGLAIHKWKLKFSGNQNATEAEKRDLTSFFKRLDMYCTSEGVTYDEIYRKFHYLLDGHAHTWYMQYRNSFTNWGELKAGIRRQFDTPLSTFQKQAMLQRRRQGMNESSMDYVAEMLRLFDEVQLNSEIERVAIIQNGLRDDLRVIAYSHSWTSVQALDHHLRMVEVSDKIRSNQLSGWTKSRTNKDTSTPKKTFYVESNESDSVNDGVNESSSEYDVEEHSNCCAFQKSRFQGKQNWSKNKKFEDKKPGPIVQNTTKSNGSQTQYEHKVQSKAQTAKETKLAEPCYNCKESGHLFKDCLRPVDRVFCFRCGMEGAYAPQCECKLTKNVKRVACCETVSSDEI